MLRNLRSRRRSRDGALLCVVVSCLLLLVYALFFHSRVTPSSLSVNYDSLLSDSGTDDAFLGDDTVDSIDTLDVVEEQLQEAFDGGDDDEEPLDQTTNAVSGLFFHHEEGVIRKAFTKISMFYEGRTFVMGSEEDRSKTAFGSDDVAVEERVRSKAIQVKDVEDALLLKLTGRKVSPLRQGWGDWFDKKGDYLRKDKMLRSNLEALNPLHNPILQDPDALGLTGITKSDKIIRNSILRDLKRLPFPSRKIIRQPSL